MLELENICVRNVLKNLNLKVEKGEFVVIVGENGAGKSTLFNVISASLKPKSGKVLINGKDMNSLNPREKSSLVANVLQDPKLGTIGNMTIFENLNIAYKRGKKRWFMPAKRELVELFKEKLSILKMGLENRLNDYAKNLSGGQRQALSLVMCALADYEVLLLDEITASLDVRSSKLVMQIAQNIAKRDSKICLTITHDSKYLASLQEKGEGKIRILSLIGGQLLIKN